MSGASVGNRPERRRLERRTEDRKRLSELETLRKNVNACLSQLADAERAKPLASAASTVVHDIRNSLGVIASTAQFALDKLTPSQKEKEAWELVVRNVENIKKILTDYLALARRAPQNQEPSSLNEVVARVGHFIDAQARRRGIKVNVSMDESIPLLTINAPAIESSLLNICINSLEAMDGIGTLLLSTRWNAPERAATIVIEDTGPGIAPEILDKVFTPFFSTKSTGTGLGLHSAKSVVEQHGGGIVCESSPGKGTKMVLTLPFEAKGPARS